MLLIARETHWSEAAILELPKARFQFYANRLLLPEQEFSKYSEYLKQVSALNCDE